MIVTQIKFTKVKFSAIDINHKWNGAAPSFINKTTAIKLWCWINTLNERSKLTEAIPWNKKYLTGWVEGLNKLEDIKSNINLNTLTSIHNQIINKDVLIIESIKLVKFITTLNKINKGEIF